MSEIELLPDFPVAAAKRLILSAVFCIYLSNYSSLKAKFHYAIWSQLGSKLVPVCDQLRTR